jgi:hypothetical protein
MATTTYSMIESTGSRDPNVELNIPGGATPVAPGGIGQIDAVYGFAQPPLDLGEGAQRHRDVIGGKLVDRLRLLGRHENVHIPAHWSL